MRISPACLPLYFVICVVLSGCNDYRQLRQTRLLMGTIVEVCIADREINKPSKTAIIGKAFERMSQLDGLLSSYKKTSDVSRVNSFADVRPVEVSLDTMKVIKRAAELNRLTDGAFDITVAPLVGLWGFGPGGAVLKMPSRQDTSRALKSVGMNKLKLNYSKRTVSFSQSGMEIDLAGIAKGYAVDCAALVLRENGVKNAMINAGGDVFCMGTTDWGRPWKIGIQHPRVRNELFTTVFVEDEAIATSGDYERFFFWNKKRISHIMNPLTGKPVVDTAASVSIIAPDCITADALATAVFVLGPQKAMDVFAKMHSVEGMIITLNGRDLEVYVTSGFKKRQKRHRA